MDDVALAVLQAGLADAHDRGFKKGAKMNYMTAMAIAEAGFDVWASKEHNKKWVRRIDGTPIKNDLLVNIAEAMVTYAQNQSNDAR
jgi:hypothetical protein